MRGCSRDEVCFENIEDNNFGGWSNYRRLTSADYAVFKKAVSNRCDYYYWPVLVATQIVAGTNYRFITKVISRCSGKVVGFCLITVYEDLDGYIRITAIETIGC